MSVSGSTFWLGRGALVAVVVAIAAFGAASSLDRRSLLRRSLRGHSSELDRNLRVLRVPLRASHVLVGQGLALGMLSTLAFLTSAWPVLFSLPAVVLAPIVVLNKRVARRVSLIEQQIELWLTAIANSLKASPSLGEAIAESVGIVPAPMSHEVDLLIKENDLGTPLDVALDQMVGRVQSQTLASAVLALKVARRSGGDLPATLEQAASDLREMARLEGVVRTKTADGRMQTVVIGVIPIPMVLLIRWIDEDFFNPLRFHFAGQLVVLAAAVLWLLAILSARKILDVDI